MISQYLMELLPFSSPDEFPTPRNLSACFSGLNDRPCVLGMGRGFWLRLSFYRWGGLSTRTWQGLHRVEKLTDDRRQSSSDELQGNCKGNAERVKDIHLDHLAEGCPVFAIDLP